MHRNYLRAAFALFITTLFLTGCMPKVESASSSAAASPSTPPPAVPISGTVADGYIAGATVFLDKNDNGILDANDPAATTDSSGKFSISAASEADFASHRLIAIVSTTAKDADFDGFVPNAYYLSYPRGGAKPPFISPFSTLVDMKMKLSGLSKEDAFSAITSRLGLQMPSGTTADDVLNANYIEAAAIWGTGITPLAEKIARISRVMANGMGKALDQARTTMNVAGDTATSPSPANESQRFKLVANNILSSIDQIVASASTLEPVSTASTPPRTKTMVQADVSSKGDALKSLFLSKLTAQASVEAQVIQALEPSVTSMSPNDLPDGLYALRGFANTQYDLASLYTHSTGENKATPGTTTTTRGNITTVSTTTATTLITLHSVDPRTDGAAAATTQSFLSTNASATWIAASALFGSAYFEGARLTVANTGGEIAVPAGPRFRLNISRYNIAGKSMDYILEKNNVTVANKFTVADKFPSGSEAFILTFVVLEDTYLLHPGTFMGAQTSIESFISAYSSTGAAFFTPNGATLGLRFSGNAGSDSGIIKFRDMTAGSDLTTDGQWKKETLRGKELLRLNSIPESYRFTAMHLPAYYEPFVALDNDGKAVYGLILRKGTDIPFAGYLFNKTAMNAINAANGFALLP